MPGKKNDKKMTRGQGQAHVKMAAGDVIKASQQIGGKISAQMISTAAQRHGIPESEIREHLRGRGLKV